MVPVKRYMGKQVTCETKRNREYRETSNIRGTQDKKNQIFMTSSLAVAIAQSIEASR